MLCRVLKVTRAGYYAWLSRGVCNRKQQDAVLKDAITRVFAQSRNTYGAPKIHAMLKRQGILTSQKRVARLMQELGIRGISKKKTRRAYRQIKEREVALDRVRRQFHAAKPNELWFADITYVKTHQGWLYLALVFDVYSRLIVGWSMASTMTAKLVDDALKMGIARRSPNPGLIHHSDRGSQYCSLLLGKTMTEHDIEPSMGAIQAPWDNAITESLMSIIKTECVHRNTFKTHHQAKLTLFDYIECFYNRLRIHGSLGNLSPMEYEDKMAVQNKISA